jgi:hypothetical protein
VWTTEGPDFTTVAVWLNPDEIYLRLAARAFQMFGSDIVIHMSSAGTEHLRSPRISGLWLLSLWLSHTRYERQAEQSLIALEKTYTDKESRRSQLPHFSALG